MTFFFYFKKFSEKLENFPLSPVFLKLFSDRLDKVDIFPIQTDELEYLQKVKNFQ